MQTARFEAPRTLADALSVIAADPDAKILAGGTDLLVQYQAGLRRLTAFVDIKHIPDLMRITVDDDGATIGAGVAAVDVTSHPTIAAWWPGLVEGVRLIGSTQIQGRCTIGGNLCNASPAADSTCALIVDRAVVTLASLQGERQVPIEQFFTGPGRTVLRPDELLVAVRLPRPSARAGDAYQRLIPRSEMDIAVASVAVSVTVDDRGICTDAAVAIGAVAPIAMSVPAAADALRGSTLDETALGRAGSAASAAADPIDDKRGSASYRRQVVGVLTRRVAAIAAARAKDR